MWQFTLLTLNTFGLPLFLAWPRLEHLAHKLASYDTTVLCLQEIQQNAYIPLLRRSLPQHTHLAFEPNLFAPKGGLVTLSQAPLASSQFIAYQNRGRRWSVGFSDWALHKGILCSEIEIETQRIIVLNTHLQANYGGGWHPKNAFARIQRDQEQELAAMIRAQPADALVIACGDFNFPRNVPLYEEFVQQSGANDPLAADPRPTYRPLPLMSSKWAIPLDYVFMRGLRGTAHARADILPLENSSARWPHQRFLTDHNAIILKVTWT
jgi:hypothetical protein